MCSLTAFLTVKIMIVLTIRNCSKTTHHFLSKWLFEIAPGVYVGNVSSRVREKIWEETCAKLKDSQAIMIFSCSNEQHMDFRTHQSTWKQIDYDGLKLICRPYPNSGGEEKKEEKTKPTEELSAFEKSNFTTNTYIILDLETTGLNPKTDEIIEVGALKVKNQEIVDSYTALTMPSAPVPKFIEELTGITSETLEKNGVTLSLVLSDLKSFIHHAPIIGHNINFDIRFLNQYGLNLENNICIDTCQLAKKELPNLKNYKLHHLADYFHIPYTKKHRALSDCLLTYKILEKLHKISENT